MKQNEKFVIENITVVIFRKKMKNIRLVVKTPSAEVFVSAPSHVTQTEIINFVASKYDWLQTQRARILANHKTQTFKDGQTIIILGRAHIIKEQIGAKNKFVLGDNTLFVTKKLGATNAELETAFWNWAKKFLKQILPEYFEKWERTTGLKSSGFSVRNMRSRWGSCNPKTRSISINVQIIQKPLVCLDYLILHELAHIKEPSHNQDFKNFLSRFMPSWREIRKLLKNN